MSGDYFGPLRCNSCGDLIKNVAHSESGDEDHIYCTKCWGVKRIIPSIKKNALLNIIKDAGK